MNSTNQQANNGNQPDTPIAAAPSPQPAAAPVEPRKLYVSEEGRDRRWADRRQIMGMIGLMVVILTVAAVLYATGKQSGKQAAGTNKASTSQQNKDSQASSPGTTGLPLSGLPGDTHKTDSNGEFVTPGSIASLAQKKPNTKQNGASAMLGDVPPFDNSKPWNYPGAATGAASSSTPGDSTTVAGGGALSESRTERESMERPSLVFVKSASTSTAAGQPAISLEPEVGIGLAPGTKLKARLESALSTAVTTPAVAVIEYDYEQNGEIIVPAGSKAFGRLEGADRSGFVSVHFDSLMYPSGEIVKFDALATDLQLRPLRGKVEGKSTGKNILVRSAAGLGEIASAVIGRSSVNQPLSEADLLRSRVGNNIGQSADQELSRLAVTEHVVVSIPANTPVYVVIEKPTKAAATSSVRTATASAPSRSPSAEELRQLLQLQREVNDNVKPAESAQGNPN